MVLSLFMPFKKSLPLSYNLTTQHNNPSVHSFATCRWIQYQVEYIFWHLMEWFHLVIFSSEQSSSIIRQHGAVCPCPGLPYRPETQRPALSCSPHRTRPPRPTCWLLSSRTFTSSFTPTPLHCALASWFPHSPSVAGVTAPQPYPHKRASEQWPHHVEAHRSCTTPHARIVTNTYILAHTSSIMNAHPHTYSINATIPLYPQCRCHSPEQMHSPTRAQLLCPSRSDMHKTHMDKQVNMSSPTNAAGMSCVSQKQHGSVIQSLTEHQNGCHLSNSETVWQKQWRSFLNISRIWPAQLGVKIRPHDIQLIL